MIHSWEAIATLSLTSGRMARDCEGQTHREFLRVGTLGLGGLTLAGLLCAQAMAADGEFIRDKAVVMLFLGGGASHIETFNPNGDQPAPYRSLTGDVQTAIPGVRFGATFPQLARLADQMVVVRSFSHGNSNHGVGHAWRIGE